MIYKEGDLFKLKFTFTRKNIVNAIIFGSIYRISTNKALKKNTIIKFIKERNEGYFLFEARTIHSRMGKPYYMNSRFSIHKYDIDKLIFFYKFKENTQLEFSFEKP